MRLSSGAEGESASDEAVEAKANRGTYRRERPKLGRNDLCWCGSGKKYKKCHMEQDRLNGGPPAEASAP